MPETEIKICGLSTPVTLEEGARLRSRVPPGIKVVLLLVNEQPQPTAQAIQAVRPDVVQFHGSETPEWLALLRQNTPLEIWKAIGVSGTDNLERAQRYKGAAHRILYDC